jgi:hypothetical protein
LRLFQDRAMRVAAGKPPGASPAKIKYRSLISVIANRIAEV